MVTGHVYRHPNCLDVYMMIRRASYRGPKYSEYKVIWITRSGRVLGEDKVRVKRTDERKWVCVG